MPKEKSNSTTKNIGIATIIFLALFFVYFTFNNSNTYKKEINSLNEEIIVLEGVLKNSVPKDSILFYLDKQILLNLEITKLLFKIDSIQKIKYEKTIDYYSISIDSNISILSNRLSKEASN